MGFQSLGGAGPSLSAIPAIGAAPSGATGDDTRLRRCGRCLQVPTDGPGAVAWYVQVIEALEQALENLGFQSRPYLPLVLLLLVQLAMTSNFASVADASRCRLMAAGAMT